MLIDFDFDAILLKAEYNNTKLYDCMFELSVEDGYLLLDQYVFFRGSGQSKKSLFQCGNGSTGLEYFSYKSSLN